MKTKQVEVNEAEIQNDITRCGIPLFSNFLGTTVLPTLLINVPFINIPLILLCWPLWEMRPELT
ncbi:MAG: hypothetical protein ACPG4V_07620, partial [Limisphaerales bacterium]